jgi:hypothetical protein
MTPWGNEPATFRLVALCLNQLRHRVPQMSNRREWYLATSLSVPMDFNTAIRVQTGVTGILHTHIKPFHLQLLPVYIRYSSPHLKRYASFLRRKIWTSQKASQIFCSVFGIWCRVKPSEVSPTELSKIGKDLLASLHAACLKGIPPADSAGRRLKQCSISFAAARHWFVSDTMSLENSLSNQRISAQPQ